MSPQQCRSPRGSERRRHSESLRPAVSSATPRLPEYGAGSSRTHQIFTSRCQGRPAGPHARVSKPTLRSRVRRQPAFVTCRSPHRSRRSQILRRAWTWSPWSCSRQPRQIRSDECRSPSGAVLHNDPSKQLRAALMNARAAKRPRSGNRPRSAKPPRSGTIPATDYGCGQSRSSGN